MLQQLMVQGRACMPGQPRRASTAAGQQLPLPGLLRSAAAAAGAPSERLQSQAAHVQARLLRGTAQPSSSKASPPPPPPHPHTHKESERAQNSC